MRVLASLTDKEGSDVFLKSINKFVDEVYASEGTKKFLESSGISCKSINELTGFDQMLGGRVKTLHPAIFAGILAKDSGEQMEEIKAAGIKPIDLVLCNLYDFQSYKNGNDEEKSEHIDIGGVSLIRAAAKNWERVTILKNKEDYSVAQKELSETGTISMDLRRKMAVEAFRYTSKYDLQILEGLSGKNTKFLELSNGKRLRYGENPSQVGILYEKDEFGHMDVFHGKEMSYNNYVDSSSAIETVLEFSKPFAVVIKHNTPCGSATGKNLGEALKLAINADRESAFGSVICINGIADESVVASMGDLFVEILIAKEFTEGALNKLVKKKNLRLIRYSGKGPESNFKTIFNGVLEQSNMNTSLDNISTLNEGEIAFSKDDIDFAWKIVAHCTSNAIVLVKNGVSVGVGAGQTSRVEATRIACKKAGENAKGSLMASDAFLPFSDNVQVAAEYGIKGIVEPGGSIRDMDVIEECKKSGISLYFTGKRVFLH